MVTVDVIIAAYDQICWTLRMLGSLRGSQGKSSDLEYRIIFIDNGSTDGTCLLVPTQLQDSDVYIRNPVNRYVSHAWNQGLKMSTADYIAIFNNDLLILEPWFLQIFVEALKKNPDSPIASVPNPGHDDGTLAGWAFMMTRKCAKEVGLFDEQFRIFHGDDDYIWRAQQTYKNPCVTARPAFSHEHSRTVHTVPEWESITEEDRKRYIEKWRAR